MKKFKRVFMAMLCGLFVVGSLSSCLSTDEEDTLTIDQQREYGREMANSYSGVVRFYKLKTSNSVEKYDSLRTSWNVSSDTLVTLNYFPVNKLDSAISVASTDDSGEGKRYRELQQAISNISPMTLVNTWYIPYTSYITDSTISFLVTPHTIKQTLTYDGETHDVYFVFLGGNYYSRGEYNRLSQTFQFQLMLYGIYEDSITTANAVPETYFKTVYVLCSNK